MLRLSALFTCLAGTSQALTPLPPCGGVEAGMRTGAPAQIAGAGIVVEQYRQNITSHGDLAEADTPPVGALSGFIGLRVSHCATGRFVAIPGASDSYAVAEQLAASAVLRDSLATKRTVTAGQMIGAAKASYGRVIVLRETEETCACNTYFPDLRAKGMTPYKERNDLGQ